MSSTNNKPTIAFWIISVIALLWNLLGANAYLQQAFRTEGFKAAYSADQLELIEKLPTWYTAIFAIAVFASTIGCILLLLRKKSAVLLLKIGLIAVLIQTIYNLFINEGREFYGQFEYSMLIMIPLVSLFLVWYSKNIDRKGWLS